ncbi:MAG: ABC transporter ATP-binding protein [bacterium]|nr:ABC transporter ATP-binding protein [bacterium]MCY3579351.1 ABC transporter ATP-binding protein [bacterium]MCY3653409.1 ABC transporter ATP-binding protein [bacterium]MDE0644102.1 ABC transporter ATP-binding protein [bacterium]MYD04711.1 ABC transporter ATP-binding protein [Acidimicrobiia bacterium]
MTDARHVSDPTVVATNLSKWFGPKVAVSQVDCSFGPGVTGLLGPNGAGKTTFLRLLAGLASPSTGEVSVLGRAPRRDPSIYRLLGFVPEDETVYEHMTARRFVEWSAALTKVADPVQAARRALQSVELTENADRLLSTYSKGMRQRAKVAGALVHDPQVLLLDEPLNGTDPIQRARLIEIVRRLGEAGHTIIVSSHVLREVDRMAGRVVAMVDGRIAAAGTVSTLRDAMSDQPRLIRIDTDLPRSLARRLLAKEWIEAVRIDQAGVDIRTSDARALGGDIARAAQEVGAIVTSVSPEDESLESVFSYLVETR